MGWDSKKHDPMLLEYLAACRFFQLIGYNEESIRPIFTGTDFAIQITWQAKSAAIRVGSIGHMTHGQFERQLHAMITDWNQHASQKDREQVWQESEMRKRAAEILLSLALNGFPICKST